MVPYVMHVAVLIAILYLSYHFLLSKVTFFRANRWVLLVGIAVAFLLPLIKVSPEISLKTQFEKPITLTEMMSKREETFEPPSEELLNLEKGENEPVVVALTNEKFKLQSEENPPSVDLDVFEENRAPVFPAIPLNRLLIAIYFAGVGILSFQFILQISKLVKYAIQSQYEREGPFHIFSHPKLTASFSFFNAIFINKGKYDAETYAQILAHEKMHATSHHTIDMLIAEFVLIIQWFNPFAWLYKKAIENNLEFLTDQSILKQGVNKRNYQMSLVREAVPALAPSFVSHYNQSFLKKRILMIHSNQSSIHSIWKYAFTVAVLFSTVLLLNDTIAQQSPIIDISNVSDISDLKDGDDPLDNSSLIDIEQHSDNESINDEQARAGHQVPSEMNDKIESAEPLNLNSSTDNSTTQSSTNDAITAEISGEWKIERWDGSVCLSFSKKHNDGKWSWTNCGDDEELIEMFREQKLPFDYSRDAGTMRLEGSFDGKNGNGTFTFTPNAQYVSYLKTNGLNDVTDERMLSCFAHEIEMDEMKEYVSGIKSIGISDFGVSDIVKLKTHDVDMDYISEMGRVGFDGLSLEDYVRMSIHDVDPDYVQSIKDYGFSDMSSDEIIRLSVHDVDADYLTDLKSAGMSGLEIEEVVRFSVHDVDASFIQSLSNAGLGTMTSEEIIRLSVHDVDDDFVKDLQAAGIKDVDVEDMVRFAVHDVDADYIEALKSMGLSNMTNEDIVRMSVHDVHEGFIRDLKLAGISDLNVEDMIRFSTHDVDADYVVALKEAGLKNLTNEDIIRGSVHDVDARFINDLQSAGVTEFDMEDLIRFSTHDVDADFILAVRKLGVKNLTNEDYIRGAVHDVDPDEMQAIIKLGFKDLTMEDFIGLQVHDIEADDIKRLQSKGHTGLSLEEYKKMIIHGH